MTYFFPTMKPNFKKETSGRYDQIGTVAFIRGRGPCSNVYVEPELK